MSALMQMEETYLNKKRISKRFLFKKAFFLFGDLMFDFKILLFLASAITLGVAFVNGFTDAPNAIASVIVTRTLKLKTAMFSAAFADFIGSLTVGLLNGQVTQTLYNIVDFGNNSKVAIVSIFSAMSAVIIWSIFAWYFGIPTSESHALIAGLTGASVAAKGGFSGINLVEWNKVFYGLAVSTIIGLCAGYLISRVTVAAFSNRTKYKSDKFFKYSQLLTGFFMSFMHGAQDSQKFAAILLMIISASNINSESFRLPSLLVSSLMIALGTAAGGERIIKSVGMDMIKLRKDQGFSADLAGSVCLLISTISGFPVSTTHTKTSAIIGVGVARSIKCVNWGIAGEMLIAWILTFPCCGFISWLISTMFLKLFI